MRSLWTVVSVSGSPLKSTRMAAPRQPSAAARRARRYSTASAVSARSPFQARAVGVRLQLVQLALAERTGEVAAQQLPQAFEFEYFRAGFQRGD